MGRLRDLWHKRVIFMDGKAKSYRGFTLVEMMVALVISVLVVAGVTMFHAHQKRVIYDQRNLSQAQQNARTAYDVISRDMRQAGYGVDVLNQDLDEFDS